MRLLPYVLVFLSLFNLMVGLPALFGRSGHLQMSLPALSDKLVTEDALAVYALVFGTMGTMLGLVRFAAGWALLGRERIDRELYALSGATFVLEMARDAQMSGVLRDTHESLTIAISALLLGWVAVASRHYCK
jgi:hypothetical protein